MAVDGQPVTWQPYAEPLRVTLVRTGFLALGVGFVVAFVQGQRGMWPLWTVFALWFTFGGHWVEIFFLNWLRPRFGSSRWAQATARLVTWLVGGTILMAGARITVLSLSAHAPRLPPWWLGGAVLVGVELLVHALSQIRRQPNFYNGLQ